MALIKELVKTDDDQKVNTGVSADYCFNENYFRLRTYKAGDDKRQDNSKQNFQLNKEMAKILVSKLNEFIRQ